MLEPARRRLGADAALHVADLSNPLPSPTVRSTTSSRRWCCTTWRDWEPTPAGMRRMLGPGGRLIASVQHPFVDCAIQDPRPDFAVTSAVYARRTSR
jgi:hypothetical protein